MHLWKHCMDQIVSCPRYNTTLWTQLVGSNTSDKKNYWEP